MTAKQRKLQRLLHVQITPKVTWTFQQIKKAGDAVYLCQRARRVQGVQGVVVRADDNPSRVENEPDILQPERPCQSWCADVVSGAREGADGDRSLTKVPGLVDVHAPFSVFKLDW